MKQVICISLMLCALTGLYAQNRLLLQKIVPTEDMKIIGLTDRFDSLQENNKFSFYCSTKVAVQSIRKELAIGGIVKQEGWNNELHIFIIKGKEIQPIQVMVNPRLNNVNTDVLGDFNYYSFDVRQLEAAHKKYPVNYICKWLSFDIRKEMDDFILVHKNDPALLCFSDVTADLPGTCIIKLTPDKKVKNAGDAEEYVEAVFKKLTKNENDYSVGFVPEMGVKEIRMEVDCSKELCDRINDPRLIKRTWKMNKFNVLTYWLK